LKSLIPLLVGLQISWVTDNNEPNWDTTVFRSGGMSQLVSLKEPSWVRGYLYWW
jgi:hypothetical protein